MPTCTEGGQELVEAVPATTTPAVEVGPTKSAFAWQITGQLGVNYASAGMESNSDFVLSQSAAIGGYVSQTPSGRHALVVLEHYSFYFNEAKNAFAILGAGYRWAKTENSSSFQIGPGVAAIGSGNHNSLLGFGLTAEGLLAGKAPTGFAIVGNLGYFSVAGVSAYIVHLGVGVGFGQ